MIAVIADDFTGAAEIGGWGLQYMLSIEISTEPDPHSKADLLIIALDTRSLPAARASRDIKKTMKDLLLLNPDLIYKKTDSVLRGHVLQEVKAQMEISEQKRALIIPANPLSGRTVINGHYYIHDKPVHLTSFAHDPEFPVHSSLIEDMLRCKRDAIHILPAGAPLPDTGISIGEVINTEDLTTWCKQANKDTLLAGASAFFNALLTHLRISANSATHIPPTFDKPVLLVCGSTSSESRAFVKSLLNKGAPVSFIPGSFIISKENKIGLYKAAALEIAGNLNTHHKAILAIDPDLINETINASELRIKMALLVKLVTEYSDIKELIIEGGATAAVILQQLKIKRMSPVDQLAPGVVRMKVTGNTNLHITSKPGSYAWPPDII